MDVSHDLSWVEEKNVTTLIFDDSSPPRIYFSMAALPHSAQNLCLSLYTPSPHYSHRKKLRFTHDSLIVFIICRLLHAYRLELENSTMHVALLQLEWQRPERSIPHQRKDQNSIHRIGTI